MRSAITRPRRQHLLHVLQQAECELRAQALHQQLKATNRSTGLVRSRKLANGETL